MESAASAVEVTSKEAKRRQQRRSFGVGIVPAASSAPDEELQVVGRVIDAAMAAMMLTAPEEGPKLFVHDREGGPMQY